MHDLFNFWGGLAIGSVGGLVAGALLVMGVMLLADSLDKNMTEAFLRHGDEPR